MKRTILVFLCIVIFAVYACLPAGAKGAGDWVAGNGFLIDNANSPVTVTETDKGIQVSHGGYYVNGVDWGGVASAAKYKLDGLKVEVYYDKVPEANSDNWIYIGFLSKPQLFQVGDIPGNPGYVCLIRFDSGAWQHFEAVDSFAQTASQNDDSFYVKSGDILTFEVKLVGGEFVLYLNGIESTVTFAALPDVFPDGEAHIVLSAYQVDSPADSFTYTIVSINGEKTVAEKAPETTAPSADAPADTPADTAPVTAAQTSDTVFAAVVFAAAAAGIVIFSKKRR